MWLRPEAHLQALQVPFETDKKFLPDLSTLWVSDTLADTLREAGVPTLDSNQILAWHLAFMLKKYSSDFIGIQETRFLLTAMEERFPELVKEASRIMPVQKIAEILQRLVSEDISVRNLRGVLEALIEWGQKEKDSVLLAGMCASRSSATSATSIRADRTSCRPTCWRPMSRNPARRHPPDLGRQLSGAGPAAGKALLENIKRTVGDLGNAVQKPVLLTSMDIRRYLRKMIEQDLYELPVLSYQELTQEINVQPLARVDL